MTTPKKRKFRLSSVVQSWVVLDGKPFCLKDWPTHTAFYDGRYRRTLFLTSRQVGKSTTLANFMITESCLIPHFSTMFVAPTQEQTKRFSNTRVGKTMRYSPVINNAFLHSELSDRVFHKQYTNGAEMTFTYGTDDADRLRGPSTDRNMYDEVQDMLYDPIITVGNETMSMSDVAFETYAGTPKTMENTIQFLWEQSTRTEWVIKCEGCGSYQYVESEKAIGKLGPVCLKCGKYINPFLGQWIDMNPVKEEHDEDVDNKIKGFHVCQPIMPLNVPAAMSRYGAEAEKRALKRWKRILTKFETLPPTLFRNEVLGVSDAIGTRLLSKEELLALCTERSLDRSPDLKTLEGISQTFAGVDWSGGGTTGVSRSVIWVWGFNSYKQKLVLLYYQVYPGQNPITVVSEIADICLKYRVAMVLGDAGEGHLPNTELKRVVGQHRVKQLQYCSQKHALTWNGVDRYTADRTTLIDNYFMLLKNKGVEFGRADDMRIAFDDILNEYEELTTTGKKVWRHSPQKPDDCLHAGLLGWVAHKLVINDVRFYQ